MAIVKPTKPDKQLPNSFGGVKTEFSADKIQNGYQESVPDILDGGNLNFLIDTVCKIQSYAEPLLDFICSLPVNKIPTTDKDNRLAYLELDTESLKIADGKISLADNVSGKEDKANKTQLIHENNTETEYPSAKAVFNESQRIIRIMNNLNAQIKELIKSFIPDYSQATTKTDQNGGFVAAATGKIYVGKWGGPYDAELNLRINGEELIGNVVSSGYGSVSQSATIETGDVVTWAVAGSRGFKLKFFPFGR